MANRLKSDAEVEATFIPLLKNAVDYVVQKIWNENRELVRQIVYEAYQPEVYDRTGEFKEAWETDVKSVRNVVEGKFQYQPKDLTVDEEHHASIIDGQPMTTYLAEIIYEGMAGAIYQSGYARQSKMFKGQAWAKKRNAWKALLKWLGRNKMKQLFEEGMKKQGIEFKRHTSAINFVEY